jgi:hypothetical protein
VEDIFMGSNIEEVPEDFKKKGIWLEEQLGTKQWAWHSGEAIKLVEYLTNHDFVILGGDVLEIKNCGLEYETSGWYYNPQKIKNWSENVKESKYKAMKYIEFFHAKNGDGYLYTISAIASASELERIHKNMPHAPED